MVQFRMRHFLSCFMWYFLVLSVDLTESETSRGEGRRSGWQLPGWQLPGWQLPGWQLPGWQLPGWQLTADSWQHSTELWRDYWFPAQHNSDVLFQDFTDTGPQDQFITCHICRPDIHKTNIGDNWFRHWSLVIGSLMGKTVFTWWSHVNVETHIKKKSLSWILILFL